MIEPQNWEWTWCYSMLVHVQMTDLEAQHPQVAHRRQQKVVGQELQAPYIGMALDKSTICQNPAGYLSEAHPIDNAWVTMTTPGDAPGRKLFMVHSNSTVDTTCGSSDNAAEGTGSCKQIWGWASQRQ